MSQIFLCVLSLSLSGALTAILILFLRTVTKKYFSSKWNYYIWMILIIRLMIPVYFELPHMAFSSAHDLSDAGIYREYQHELVQGHTVEMGKTGEFSEPKEQTVKDAAASYNEQIPDISEAGQPGVNTKLQPLTIVGFVWLLGVVLALLLQIISYMRFFIRMRKTCKMVNDWQIVKLLEELSARISVNGIRNSRRRQTEIYESAAVAGPITIGLRKPVIIIPKEETDIPRLKMMLHHELIHIKRKDLWIKWLYQILLCIHWFNPVLYLTGRKINADCELSCDEAVLQQLTENGKRMYGNLLIDTAERNLGFAGNVFSTSLLGRKKDLQERLQSILHNRKQTGFKVFLSGCVCAGVMLLSACGSVYTGDEVSVRVSGEELSDQYTSMTGELGEKYTSYTDQLGGFWDEVWDEVKEAGMIGDGYGLGKLLTDSMTGVDEKGEAYQAYEDEKLMAGEDVSDWAAYYNYRGGREIKGSGVTLNGTQSVLIVYAQEEMVIEVNSSFDLVDGRFKIIHAAPDGTVETVDDIGKPGARKITLPKGRNVIKMVGQKSKLKELEISYAGLDTKRVGNVYYSEEEEYAAYIQQAFDNGASIEKDKVMDAMYYMDGKTLSKAFACLLEQGETFSQDELYDIFIYSDEELSGRYLLQAINEGKAEPLDAETISELMPYLSDQTQVEFIISMDDQLTFEELNEFVPYLSEEGTEQCLIRYIESGNTLTYSQFDEIAPYLSQSTIKKIDSLLSNKPATHK